MGSGLALDEIQDRRGCRFDQCRGRGSPSHGTMPSVGLLWEELDCLGRLRAQAEQDLVRKARKHSATKILRSIPGIAPLSYSTVAPI
jgi:hypothetical protein